MGCNDTVNFNVIACYCTYCCKVSTVFQTLQVENSTPLKLFDFVLRSLFAALQTSPGGDDKAHFNDVYTAASG